MSRRIMIQVTAPAVVIGLLLCVTCLVSAWYINRLQQNLANVHSQNVASLEAALELERMGRDGALAGASPRVVAMTPKRPATVQLRPQAPVAQRRHSEPAPAPAQRPAAAPRQPAAPAKRGPGARSQGALATAAKDDPDWKEF